MSNSALKDKDDNILNPKIPRYENLKRYSEQEQVVGKWIDGKRLYRKVVKFGAFPSNGQRTVNHNIENLQKICQFTYTWYDLEDAKWFSGPRVDNSNTMCKIGITYSNLYIEGLGNVAWADRTSEGQCVIYYTKTTD